ncbi:MAG: hypothetical protein ACR2J7_09745 [Luteimonas sp.]
MKQKQWLLPALAFSALAGALLWHVGIRPPPATDRPAQTAAVATPELTEVPGPVVTEQLTSCAPGSRLAQARRYLDLGPVVRDSELPLTWERQIRGKHLVVLGNRHKSNPRSPMYDRMEAVFDRVQPELVLHEGVFPAELRALSRDKAIEAGADLGFTVYLATQRGIPLRSGDASTRLEVESLLKVYSPEEVLVFLTAQRLIGSTRDLDVPRLTEEYPAFFEDYLVANGFPRRAAMRTWRSFEQAYARVTGAVFSAASWNPELIDPARDAGRLSEMARALNAERDACLVTAIGHALEQHERVLVTFGYLHVRAVEPVLDDMFRDYAAQGQR